jgi:hypothetical protein
MRTMSGVVQKIACLVLGGKETGKVSFEDTVLNHSDLLYHKRREIWYQIDFEVYTCEENEKILWKW